MDKRDLKAGIDLLTAEIRRHLQQGIDLDPETETLITELTGHSIRSLNTLLKDDDEAESVISLLMTPDTHLQTAIEPLLWQYPIIPKQKKAIIHALGKPPLTILIRLSDGFSTAQFAPPNWATTEFIQRLHLTWQINPELYLVTDHFLTDHQKSEFWVRLRNAQSTLTPEIAKNLAILVEKNHTFREAFFDHLDLLITAWSDAKAHTDPYKALARLKGSYIKAMGQTHRFEKAARSHNMETLMLQGLTTPTITLETALHQISMIDNLTLTLFGTISSVDDTPELVSVTEKHLKQMIQ